MSDRGFVIIDRKIEDWRYWDNLTLTGFWLHLLIKANWKEAAWRFGEHVGRGEMITSIGNLAAECGTSRSQIYRMLKKLEAEHQIELRPKQRYTLIKVLNYEVYQDFANGLRNIAGTTDGTTLGTTDGTTGGTSVVHNRTKKQINKETKEQYISGETPEDYSETDSVIDYLNLVTGQKYKYSKTSRKHIHARLSEGFTVEDCKSVIDKKTREWIGTDMMKYLNPETLFAGKFEKYLNQIETPRKRDLDDILMEEHFKNEQRRDSEDSEDDQFGFSKINWD